MKNIIFSQLFNPTFHKAGLLLQITPLEANGDQSAWMSVLTNPIALIMLFIMVVLLFVIRSLTKLLIKVTESNVKNSDTQSRNIGLKTSSMIAVLLTCSFVANAQEAVAAATPVVQAEHLVGGMAPVVFYLLAGVILIESLLVYILLKAIMKMMAKQDLSHYDAKPQTQSALSQWWFKINDFRPMEQEADLDLGHDYDGIRELDNKMPSWWVYGFYATIFFAVFYLWRYHVVHAAPLQEEEYTISVDKANKEVSDYLKTKGDNINESNIKMLGAEDITEGANLFKSTCVACHMANGGGGVGPNLTDNYWLNGGDITSVFKTIKYGIRAMPAWQNNFSSKQLAQLASFVESLRNTNVAGGKAPQGEVFKEVVAEATGGEVTDGAKIPATETQDSTKK